MHEACEAASYRGDEGWRILNRFAVLVRALRLTAGLEPRLFSLSAGLLVLDASLGLGVLYALRLLVDRMVAEGTTQELGALLWLVGVVAVFAAISRSLSALAAERLGQGVSDRLDSLLNRKLAKLELAKLESAEFHDLINRALYVGSARPAQVVNNVFQTASNFLLLAGMSALLMTIHWALVALLAVALIPGTLLRAMMHRRLFNWQMHRIRWERHASYLRWLMVDKSAAKEVRLFRLGELLAERYDDFRTRLRSEKFVIALRRTLVELALTASVTVAFFVLFGWLMFRAASGEGTYGELVLFLMVFMRAQGIVQTLKSSAAALFDDSLYLQALFKLKDVGVEMVDPPVPAAPARRACLEVDAVSFVYPETDREVLHEVSLSIPEASVVAIVGANGSGKSTLLKLICRLYDPTRGVIRWGGTDVRSFRVEDYRSRVGALFQDFVCFDADLTENIRFGNLTLPRESEQIRLAGSRALVDEFVSNLPAAYDTHLGRVLEEGAELSVGQWQRVGLARALVSEAGLLILDEPTSAMDPVAEARLFSDLRETLGGRSALIISHRLSIVRGADYIYVMSHGRVAEQGTHEELLDKRGLYFALFTAQADGYR